VDCENFEFTGFWANINPTGASATAHAHPNNFLGGVYYVQTDPEGDSIYFTDPRPQAGVISPPYKEENIYSGNEASVPAKPGRMVVFPAWLVHGVPANGSEHDRISMSFNVMFPQFTENMSQPKWEPSVRLKREITD
ncbi:MAG: TIGR02466 family protein, partial [Alphaproteobacteria bacterium]